MKHGLCDTRLHSIWRSMNTRCTNKHRSNYKNYGGRGITVCADWRDNFLAFYEWSGEHHYSDELTIDRIDNDGNYEPSNCKWSTNKEQSNNKRTNHNITFQDETHTIAEWAEHTGIHRRTIMGRLKMGWSIEKILTEPIHENCRNRNTEKAR